jgi:hypothetical protein
VRKTAEKKAKSSVFAGIIAGSCESVQGRKRGEEPQFQCGC